MGSRARFVLAAVLAMLLAACATAPGKQEDVPAAAAPPPPPPRDEATAAAIERVLAGDHRSAANRARDGWRHPADTLLFFGIKPDMTVAELWPGAGGWYTEVLAPLLAEHGRLYAAQVAATPGNAFTASVLAAYRAKLDARPDLYGKVMVTTLGPGGADFAPPGSCDLVLTFRNLHNWMNQGYEKEAIAAMHRALKPGGILGVVDHRADPARPPDPRASNGYVSEAYAIWLFEAAGFVLVGTSEVNANPNDSKDYEQGVWTLPPELRQGTRDRAKYEAIGESDRFTLKFRKMGSDPIS
jgi:predicted methyltransferase